MDMLSEVLGKCWIYIETRERWGEVRDVKSGTLDLVGLIWSVEICGLGWCILVGGRRLLFFMMLF